MFQYVLGLLLINTYYQSLGNPLPTVNPHHPVISDYLLGLVSECDNKFVSEQIQNAIPDCNITAPPMKEQQFHCLMFYDINKQLCSAIAASKIAPKEDDAAKINENQDINTFCTSIKDFVFTDLTVFPFYKEFAQKQFNTSLSCGKVCGYSGFANEETRYYCKYFKWGINMLNNPTTAPTSNVSKDTNVSVSEVDTSNVDIPVNSGNAHNSSPIPVNAQLKPVTTETHTVKDKTIQANVDQNAEASVPKPDISQTPEEIVQNEDPSIDLNKYISSSTVTGLNQTNGTGTKLKLVNDVLETDPVKDNQKDTVIDNPAHQKTEDEYTNEGSEDENDGEEDDNFGEKINLPEQGKNTVEKQTNDISQKAGYTRTEAEDYPEEGDNFFPFFLTAVVLVVLLYILYHNKNKVTKMFFGLILEGRQGGRRRNSRGHAYRRLDTLEQAMTAKSATPPSKIIY